MTSPSVDLIENGSVMIALRNMPLDDGDELWTLSRSALITPELNR